MQVITRDAVLVDEPITTPQGGRWAPRLVRALERVHNADRSALSASVDAAIVAATARALHWGPVATLLVVAAALLVLGRSHAERSTLETQGIAWYCSALAGPISTFTVLLIAVAGALSQSPSNVARFIVLTASALIGLHAVTWTSLLLLRRSGVGLRSALVVGEGAIARTVIKKLTDYPEAGLRPVGIVTPAASGDQGEGLGERADPADLPALIERENVGQLVIVPERHVHAELVQCLEACAGLDLHIAMLPPLADLFINPRQVSQVGGLPLLPVGKPTQLSAAIRPGKRLFDLAVSVTLLLLMLPVLAMVALAIKLEDHGPVIFRQRRIGLGGRAFNIYKFRSMDVGAEHRATALEAQNVTNGLLFKVLDDPRVTRVGAIIRRLSIDELPQLLNVVKGDMSLVGPRPLAAEANDFSVMDGRRHSVLPGITGYWQVTGGNGLTYQEMVKLDLAYIQNWTLWLDVRLLAKTFPALVHRRSPW
jgi:exopolysaccharide biosynthesis polyprenyl glycosylphosphotransferase